MHSKLFDGNSRDSETMLPGLARTMGAETMLWASDATWVHSMLSVKELHRVGERPALFVSPRDDGRSDGRGNDLHR
jgi:hypothetical protein